ncbi:MAG: S8 family serine peptidase [Cellvibrionaceae bacterium]
MHILAADRAPADVRNSDQPETTATTRIDSRIPSVDREDSKDSEAKGEGGREKKQERLRSDPQQAQTRPIDTPSPNRNAEHRTEPPQASRRQTGQIPSDGRAEPQRPDPQRPVPENPGPQNGGPDLNTPGDPVEPEIPLREILLTTETLEQADQQRSDLAQDRIAILSRRNLPGLGFVLSTYRVPDDVDMDALITELQDRYPGSDIEQNGRFYPLSDEKRRYAQRLVGVAVPSTCAAHVPLAMLDSGVNTSVPALLGAKIETHDMTGALDASDQHGTAVATLMLSNHPDFPGLAPRASLLAINVFARDPNGLVETRSNWLLYGLDLVASINPTPVAVNMSFGGDYSRLLEKVFERLSRRMVLVAAAGNSGSNQPTYPAAYDSVHGVGSLNANGKRSRHSSYGAHVALMAPGEDVWSSGSDGKGLYVTGSSFAASFATVALAFVNQSSQPVSDYLASLGESRQITFEGLCGGDG